ncbi:MAG: ROK family protein [Verrucomicrobiales bacterium]|nr:ROK family protein [Verrucomicrobiales bacterium]
MSDSPTPLPEETTDPPLLAGIEAGGTKYVCAVATDPTQPLLEERFPTEDPETTIARVIEFFRNASEQYGQIRSMGIGTFGPADIHVNSPGYGSILTTPKRGWAGFNVVNAIRDGLDFPPPIAFETDVNAAVLGEAEYGAGRNHRFVAYITVGTGIGAAYLHDGVLIHGRMHPEVGHMVMPDFDTDFGKDTNHCPFHESCFEGRAAGPSIEARWGTPGFELPDDHEAWDLQAAYLAAGCMNLTAVWSPDIILLGGGVSQKAGLIDRVRREFEKQAGGYWSLPPLDLYLRTPELDQNAGIVGALTLARRLL